MPDEKQDLKENESVEERVLDPVVETEAQNEGVSLQEISEAERKRTYKTGSKVAAFIFFAIAFVAFAICEYFATIFLYTPLIKGVHDFGEAIAAIFGFTFGLVITGICGVAQLPFNIVSIVLFARLRGKSDKKWENRLFTAMLVISIVTLVLLVVTFAAFFISGAKNN